MSNVFTLISKDTLDLMKVAELILEDAIDKTIPDELFHLTPIIFIECINIFMVLCIKDKFRSKEAFEGALTIFEDTFNNVIADLKKKIAKIEEENELKTEI